MTSRDTILAAVRANQPTPTPAIPAIPLFERPSSRSLLEDFRDALVSMGGKFVPGLDGKPLDALLKSLFPDAQVVCSATPEALGTRLIDSSTEPVALADVDVAVVRAAFGVAETGSVWLSENELTTNALAYLAQHLLVLLDPEQIVGNLHQAYRDPRFRTARYAVLVTGPSATADIEGVLVHGAQGVRSLTVAIVSSPHGDSHLTTRLRSADDQLNRKSFSVDNNAGSPLLALLRGLEGNARHLRYNAGPSSRRNLDS